MTSFKPLVRVKLADQIYTQLRDAICGGQYGNGQALPSERDLATAFGVSRVAIREALVTLQTQGLVERSHGRAARALPESRRIWSEAVTLRLIDEPTEKDVRDVKQARIFLEIEMARIAARTCSSSDAAMLKAALEANRRAISDSQKFLQTDMSLHKAIASLSGNDLFVGMSHDFLSWLARFELEAVHVEGSVMLSHREHANIVDLIVARDQDGAANAMFEHLSRTHLAYGRLHSLKKMDDDRLAMSSGGKL